MDGGKSAEVLIQLVACTEPMLAAATRFSQLRQAAEAASQILSFQFFFLALRAPSLQPPLDQIVTSYPDDFLAWYARHQAAFQNPNLKRALSAPGPFEWSAGQWSGTSAAILEKLKGIGVVDGMSSGTYGPHQSESYLAFASAIPLAAHPVPRAVRLAAVSWLGPRLHGRAVELLSADRTGDALERLTKRERDSVRRFARGQTAREISHALHVTERTVHFYLDSVAKKLGTGSRREAVYRAMQLLRRDPLDYPLRLEDIQ